MVINFVGGILSLLKELDQSKCTGNAVMLDEFNGTVAKHGIGLRCMLLTWATIITRKFPERKVSRKLPKNRIRIEAQDNMEDSEGESLQSVITNVSSIDYDNVSSEELED